MSDLPAVVDGHDEEMVERAAALDRKVRDTIGEIREGWATLAESLYEFDRIRGWEKLGLESLHAWLADPEIELSRSQAFGLVEAWRELVVLRGVEPRQLARCEVSKVREVLGAVRRGQVEAARALADTEALTLRDLRTKYVRLPVGADPHGKTIEPDEYIWDTCEHCGSRYQRRVT